MAFKSKTTLFKSNGILSTRDLNDGDLAVSRDHHGISLVAKYNNQLYRTHLQNTNIQTKLNRASTKGSLKSKFTSIEVEKDLILRGGPESSEADLISGSWLSYDKNTKKGLTIRQDQAYGTKTLYINAPDTFIEGDVHIGNSYKLCFDGYIGESDGTYDAARPIKQTYIWEDGIDNLEFVVGNVSMMTMIEGVSDYISIPVLTHMTNTCMITSTTADQLSIRYDASNYAHLNVSASGDLEIETIGAGTTDSDITLNADGDIFMDAAGGDVSITSADVKIAATKSLYFDGGGDTYIYESGTDVLRVVVGSQTVLELTENGTSSAGDDGNVVHFKDSCAGFTQLEPTYDATDTLVDFRQSNKQFVTFGSGNITNLNLYFPLVSGNFVLLIKQDGTGSRTITNYKVRESDGSLADGESSVKFAGGSNPTLTTDANHVDILSFYWDADNEIAYGVATLDFQF